ncbi:tyrosine-type recombinase/integrase [Bradyrhizobium sp.]|uniref:tyrosine-type recombinase/integrase n=1 Tax=Bradyrhizobium sp. TaxID=376 RepID=UPI0039E3474C
MYSHGAAPASLYTAAGKRKYLVDAERARFIEAAKACPRTEIGTLCLTLVYTGCRITEALKLERSSVEAEAGFIAFRCLKKRNGKTVIREVPVPSDLLNAIRQMRATSEDDRLWHFSRSRAWQLVKDVMAKAHIPNGIHATPKGLRHGFGIHAVQSGIPLNLVQRWLGHARMETTAIYLQAMGCEERQIAMRMWT